MDFIANCLVGIAVIVIVIPTLFLVWGILKLFIHYDRKRLVREGLCPFCGQKEDAAKSHGGHEEDCQDAIPF